MFWIIYNKKDGGKESKYCDNLDDVLKWISDERLKICNDVEFHNIKIVRG